MKIVSAIFKTLILSLAIIAQVNFSYAQTQGGIIPNGKTTYLDQNGNPLSGGKIFFDVPSTTTPKPTYQDINLTIPNTNPVILDSAGRALIWGTGNYRQIVQDQNSNVIWDVTTSVAGTGGTGPTSTGDGDLVGTIKPWAGMTAPNQYQFAYGQQLSRTTFSALFTATTSSQSVFCVSGNSVLTGLSDTTNFWIGMTVEVACVSGGVSTIINKTSNTVQLAVNANATQNTTALFFPWGNGNGSTTFTLPDFRGLLPVGNNIMGGTASGNLSTTFFGSTGPNSSGALGGNQSVTLGLTNLPQNITSSGVISVVSTTGFIQSGAGAQTLTTGGSAVNTGNVTSTGTANVTSNNTGSGGVPVAFSIIPPSKTINYIIKVTPDANSATATGVTDINGMTGSIACGGQVTCTGNVINITAVTSLGGMTGAVSCGSGISCAGNIITASGGTPLIGTGSTLINTNYTALNADANHTIYITGSTANQTVTVNALSSYASNVTAFQICNSGTHRWTIASTDAGSLKLWPGQCNSLIPNTTSSALIYALPFQRYATGGSITFFASTSGCSDTNDGLSADASGRICTINTAIALLISDTDGRSHNPIIQLADGTYNQAIFFAGYGVMALDGIVIEGHVGTSSAVIINAPAGNAAIAARDYGILFAQDLEVACTNTASTGINASQFSTIDIKNVIFGSCDSHVMTLAQDGGHIDFNTGNTIVGNAANFCFALNAGSFCSMPSQTFTCIGALTISIFVEANVLAGIEASGAAFSGCGSITGQRYVAGGNGAIQTNGGGATFFPGTVAGSSVTGGQYL